MDKRLAPVLRILERLPISAVVASPISGRVIWTNSHNIKLAGASHPDQLIGRSILDFIEPAQHGVALRDIAAVALGQSPPPVVYHLKRLDGGTADGQIASVPLMYEGKPAMLSLITEVTEREQVMRELRDSEERYRNLVDALPEGLTVVVDDRVVFANAAVARLLSLDSPDELIGSRTYDFIAPEYHKSVREARKQVLLTKSPVPGLPIEIVSPNGTRVHVLATTRVVRWGGVVATQAVLQPIDEG